MRFALLATLVAALWMLASVAPGQAESSRITLTVTREHNTIMDRLKTYDIYVNGIKAGGIDNGETVSFSIQRSPDDSYLVELKSFLLECDPVTFHAYQGEGASLRVEGVPVKLTGVRVSPLFPAQIAVATSSPTTVQVDGYTYRMDESGFISPPGSTAVNSIQRRNIVLADGTRFPLFVTPSFPAFVSVDGASTEVTGVILDHEILMQIQNAARYYFVGEDPADPARLSGFVADLEALKSVAASRSAVSLIDAYTNWANTIYQLRQDTFFRRVMLNLGTSLAESIAMRVFTKAPNKATLAAAALEVAIDTTVSTAVDSAMHWWDLRSASKALAAAEEEYLGRVESYLRAVPGIGNHPVIAHASLAGTLHGRWRFRGTDIVFGFLPDSTVEYRDPYGNLLAQGVWLLRDGHVYMRWPDGGQEVHALSIEGDDSIRAQIVSATVPDGVGLVGVMDPLDGQHHFAFKPGELKLAEPPALEPPPAEAEPLELQNPFGTGEDAIDVAAAATPYDAAPAPTPTLAPLEAYIRAGADAMGRELTAEEEELLIRERAMKAGILPTPTLAAEEDAPVELEFVEDLEEARRKAEDYKCALVIVFLSETSSSRSFYNSVLMHQEVAELLRMMVCVRVDYEKDSPLAVRYEVRRSPTTVVLNRYGFVQGRISESKDPGKFASELRELTGHAK